jgi:Trk K+ transport system NAD-binding subunit
MHGMICGLGQVGYRVALLALDSGHQVTIVTIMARPEWERELRASGARIFFGDARDEDFLVSAGLHRVDWLISATSHDLTNIEIALDAKRLHPRVRTVARAFDQYLAKRLESSFGIDRVLAMSQLAAPAFISSAFGDELVANFQWGEDRYGVVKVSVREAHDFAGKTVAEIEEQTGLSALLTFTGGSVAQTQPARDLVLQPGDTVKLVGPETSILALGSLPRHVERETAAAKARKNQPFSLSKIWVNAPRDLRFLLLGLLSFMMLSTIIFKFGLGLSPVDAFYFVVSTVTTTGYGDITVGGSAPAALKLFTCLVMLVGSAAVATLYSIITDALISARFRQLATGHEVPEENHVIVVGLGDVGFRTCEELLRLGVEPVGIDLHPDGKFVTTLRTQMAVITGDAREEEVLEQANVGTAAAIIATTSDDTVNLSIGLLAREEPGHRRIVLRIFDDRFAGKVQSTVAFDGALSASRIAAPTFLGSAAYPGSLASFVIRGMLVTVFARSRSELKAALARGEIMVLDQGERGGLTTIATRLHHPRLDDVVSSP